MLFADYAADAADYYFIFFPMLMSAFSPPRARSVADAFAAFR